MKFNLSYLLISFLSLTTLFCKAQELKFYVVDYTCDENTKYIKYGTSEKVYIDGIRESLNEDSIKSVKVKGKNFIISKEFSDYTITPKKLGKSNLVANVKLKNGDKLKIVHEFVVVEMPEIEVGILVTSPDSKFMWLNILDKKTRKPINPDDFDICMLDFELLDSSGKTKESGVYIEKNDFFPSVTLTELPSRFELNDQLHIGLSLVHKKYNLLVGNGGQIITITKIWK